jgi:methyl-accepting chemotaxis protein
MTSNTTTRIKHKLDTSFGVMLVLAAALALSAWNGNGELTALFALAAAVGAFMLHSSLQQAIVQPVGLMTQHFQQLAEGKHADSALNIAANSDLGELATAINTYVTTLTRALDTEAEHQRAWSEEINQLVNAAADGNFSRRIDLSGKQGIFLALGEAINRLLDSSENGLSEVVRVLNALATGDLTETIEGNFAGTFGRLRDDSNATVENLKGLIADIKNSADSIHLASGEISRSNSDLTHRSVQQAESLQQTAASMEQLASTVKQNAVNAEQANVMVLEASAVATKGGTLVNDVVVTMNNINQGARRIVDIISVIDGIAFQTNILALNAAVEAARAGEQGRGFAVVAAEVRSLAQRSAGAAKEIKALISDSVEKIDDGAALVKEAGQTMTQIVSSVRHVTEIMGDISTASAEQSNGIDQVKNAVAKMDAVTQQNATQVAEAASAARLLEQQALRLQGTVSAFLLVKRDAEPDLEALFAQASQSGQRHASL